MSSFRQFLAENKTWWILPILIVIVIVGFILISDQPEGIAGEDTPFNYDEY
jgi:hypothetical protein